MIPAPAVPVAAGDTVCKNGSANLAVTNPADSVYWYTSPAGGKNIFSGSNFLTPALTQTKTYYAENVTVNSPLIFTGAKPDSGGGAGAFIPGEKFLVFDAYEDFTLEAVTVYAADSGYGTIQLRDQYGDERDGRLISFTKGKNRIALNLFIPAGKNLQLFLAGKDDSFYSDTSGAAFPYEIPGLLSVKNSSRSKAHYFFFYKWEVKTLPLLCKSLRVPVTVVVDTACTNGFSGIAGEDVVKIYPTPFSDFAAVEINPAINASLFIVRTIFGKEVVKIVSPPRKFTLEKNNLPSGIYFYELWAEGGIFSAGKLMTR
jgi:hypothetical protein